MIELKPEGLYVGGLSASELAERHKTPLLVLDEDVLRRNARRYLGALSAVGGGRAFYASKALSLKGLVARIHSLGLGIEVVSSGELLTAVKAGVPPSDMLVNGSPKSASEIDFALECGVDQFVADSVEEIDLLAKGAAHRSLRAKVLLRVAPGVEASTHKYIATGAADAKFGISVDKVAEAVGSVLGCPDLEFLGLQAHVGSNLFDFTDLADGAAVLMTLSKMCVDRFGVFPGVIDIGGGIGVKLDPTEEPVDVTGALAGVAAVVRQGAAACGRPMPQLWVEPGRSMVNDAGVMLYRVEALKQAGDKTYVIVDGGMGDNIRPALYDAEYLVWKADGDLAAPRRSYDVAGRYCESGDVIARSVKLPEMKVGELVAVPSAGAYTYSMASHYNRVGRPEVIMAGGGCTTTLARRETLEDLVRLDEAVSGWPSSQAESRERIG